MSAFPVSVHLRNPSASCGLCPVFGRFLGNSHRGVTSWSSPINDQINYYQQSNIPSSLSISFLHSMSKFSSSCKQYYEERKTVQQFKRYMWFEGHATSCYRKPCHDGAIINSGVERTPILGPGVTLRNLSLSVSRLSRKCGSSDVSQPYGTHCLLHG
jgi:hypothetical protein